MEVSFTYYTAFGLTIGSEIALPYLKEVPATAVDLTIKRGHVPVSPPLEPTKVYRSGLNARFAQNDSECFWLDWSPLMTFMAVGGNELILDTEQTDEDLLALFTLSEAIGLILFQKGYFLLHGSAIQLNDKGVVFLGQPGAGKSTTVAAFAQTGIPVLSDDMVCIRLSEGQRPMIIPAFSQIKLWQNAVDGLNLDKTNLAPVREGLTKFSWHESVSFAETAVPLQQIFVLEPPDQAENTPIPVAKSQLPIEFLNHFPLPDSLLTGRLLKEYFEKSSLVADSIPLYKLSRPATFPKLHEFVQQLKASL
ncbi:phosphoenolpyruvate carboxykinase (ATP) [Spirosoma agri]|uniref:Serine kinase n=1 Tax=Spirosoma agri TaxID=1987381 RepID=A0A6M0IKM3_9BACT|nr:serine kinase [Spirosoma agri]NEU68185.1 serine kinase [Spirosoma agri]